MPAIVSLEDAGMSRDLVLSTHLPALLCKECFWLTMSSYSSSSLLLSNSVSGCCFFFCWCCFLCCCFCGCSSFYFSSFCCRYFSIWFSCFSCFRYTSLGRSWGGGCYFGDGTSRCWGEGAFIVFRTFFTSFQSPSN